MLSGDQSADRMRRFALLPSTQILCLLSSVQVTRDAHGEYLTPLYNNAANVDQILRTPFKKIQDAIKDLTKRPKGKGKGKGQPDLADNEISGEESDDPIDG